MKTPVKTLRGRGLKLAPCVIGAALLCVTPSGHEALADEAVLDVRYADGRLTVHARSADPKVLLQRVGEATGLEVKLRGSAGDGVTASAVVEGLALEAALARLFRKLSQTVPVSYVLLYDEEGPRRIIAIFGRGEPGATIVARTPAKSAPERRGEVFRTLPGGVARPSDRPETHGGADGEFLSLSERSCRGARRGRPRRPSWSHTFLLVAVSAPIINGVSGVAACRVREAFHASRR